MSAPGSMRANACAMRSASGESTPRSTQPLCVTLKEGERGGSKVSGSQAG